LELPPEFVEVEDNTCIHEWGDTLSESPCSFLPLRSVATD